MRILLSPSKTQSYNTLISHKTTQPQFLKKSQQLNDQLRQLQKPELSKLLKTSAKLTEETYQKVKSFCLPFTEENASPALMTFQGDAFKFIDTLNYTDIQLDYTQKHLFILSGLYGILRPLDLIQPYRLEMGTPVQIGANKNLYQFWQKDIMQVINESLKGEKEKFLISLASHEYAKIVNKKKLNGQLITLQFKQQHKDGYRSIPIHSKRARSLMAHFVISNEITTTKDLLDFNLNGYRYTSKESNPTQWIFHKAVN